MSVNAIPASRFVSSIPSVLAASGAPITMNGIIIDQDPSIPYGTVQQFPNQAAVGAWYGVGSNQYLLAGNYFNAFNGAGQIPSSLGFFQYNTAPVAGYMRGGSVAGLSLTQLQALSGTISVVIDGVAHVSANINLASAASFTAAAALLQTGLQTGAPNTTATVTYDALRKAFVIKSGTTGVNSSVAFGTDASLSPQLNFTAALGAVTSAGAAAQTPAGAMAAIEAATQNWASFMTSWDPDAGAPGGPIKQQFSLWTTQQEGAYLYAAWDTDPTPSTQANDAACFGALVTADGYNGTVPIWALATAIGAQAAMLMGAIAAIDFTSIDGRVDFAYLSQSGLAPVVTSETVYNNLVSNGYNAYVAAATASQQFQFFQPGSMPGEWAWIDPYVNQIYFNSLMQTDLLTYRTQIKWIPYTEAGYNGIRQALQPAINQMGQFGAWAAGVELSGAQIAEVNQQAGADIATTLQNQGWYLQITDPGPAARQARLSPNIYFWYTDGGNVNQLVVNSIDVE